MWRTRVRKRRGRAREPVVCSIGSTDPTAGAGLFLDAAVYARLGRVRPVYAVAGITAQNSRGVREVVSLSPAAVVAQLDAIEAQVRPDAFRIGLIPSKGTCVAVARWLRTRGRRAPVVVDPVIAATSGARLIEADAIGGLRALLRAADVATPNAAEASALSSSPVASVDDAERAALRLAATHGCAVLVTGGHVRSGARIVDVLASPDGSVERFAGTRLRASSRGTGCMLAASLAASLARGSTMSAAVRSARRFVRAALASSRPLGRGKAQFAGAGVGLPAV